jgi:E3 ubiquitin-protein ligase RNF14
VQSATISSPKKQSDGHDVDILDGETSDVEIVMQESTSLASIGTSTLMFRHLSIRAFRETFQEGNNEKKTAETNNNNNAPEKSSKVMVWKQPKEKVCSVCAEMLPWQHFPKFADCEHDPDICHGCFLLWLKQQMESVTNVLCPSSGCSRTITHEDVHKSTPQDVFTR